MMLSTPTAMFCTVPDRKRKRYQDLDSESESEFESDLDCTPELSPRPHKMFSPSPRRSLGLPADEPLNIDSRTLPAPTSRRPRARALECVDHSWGCRLCGK